VITSRSAGTAMEYALAVVEKLIGGDEARQLADDLLFFA
jgi:4-methyl-5(b-hydroxyethyl)-thiazole monophosphate biosynthesis